jgi:hypothetical protein
MVAEGVVRGGRFGGKAREARRLSPSCPPYGWWLRAQVSRDAPPPLPGGYKLGEKVFFTGASETAPSGHKWVHGQQGEVMGPANCEATKGKGVSVRFPGNMGNVNCYLATVRRLSTAPLPLPARLRPTHATLPTHRAPALPPSTWLCPAEPTPVASRRGPAPRVRGGPAWCAAAAAAPERGQAKPHPLWLLVDVRR